MAATKVDFKRELRALYAPGADPQIVEVPELAFLMVDGRGDPNVAPAYREAVRALYAVSYAAKFALKRAGVLEYGVMPLEGLWWAPDMAAFTTGDKSEWNWTAMIMQPDLVTPDVVAAAKTTAAKNASADAIGRMRLDRFAEGQTAQILHTGPYAAEGPTIARLHAFIAEHGCELRGHHHEIYLSNPSRTTPEKLKTIIRQPVARR